MGSTIELPKFSAECEVSGPPPPGTDSTKYISRWSNANVKGLPAFVIVPAIEQDIISAIKFAKENGYKLIPAGGTHGPFVPIDERVVYLDMCKFDSLELNEELGTVKLGGGIKTGPVLIELAKRGWYTSISNSNEVGMVGYAIGGGGSVFNGLHGLGMDSLLHFRIITASGSIHEVGEKSSGNELDLFNVLCGAGFGFGVVTSVTMRARRIKDLHMKDDKLWKRELVFTPDQVHVAAELFAKLQNPSESAVAVSLVCLKAPLSSPAAGNPMIVIFINSIGPAELGESVCAPAFEEKYTSKTVVAKNGFVTFEEMNGHAVPYNVHGDYKENHAAWSKEITAEAIVEAVDGWLKIGNEAPSATETTNFVLAAKNPAAMLAEDTDERKFFPRRLRDKKIFIRVAPWWKDPKDAAAARRWARKTVETLCPLEGKGVRGLATNLSPGIDMGEVYEPYQLDKIKQLKGTWDPSGLFWNPVVDGV